MLKALATWADAVDDAAARARPSPCPRRRRRCPPPPARRRADVRQHPRLGSEFGAGRGARAFRERRQDALAHGSAHGRRLATLLQQDVSRADEETLFWPETLEEPDWGAETFTSVEIACAMIFVHIVEGLSFPATVETRAERDALARPWFEAAALCRTARRELGDFLEGGAALPPALETVADYFERRGKSLRGEGDPFIIERSAKERGDDATRLRVRWIAALTASIFGRIPRQFVATIASVALGSDVSVKSVENWTQ